MAAMILVRESDGTPLKVGDKVKTFRGENRILRGWREPHTINSSGRVFVSTTPNGREEQYFPSVIGAVFKVRE